MNRSIPGRQGGALVQCSASASFSGVLRLAVCCVCLGVPAQTQRAIAAPPRVISATPDNGDTDIDPATRELQIEFDQDMSTGGASVCGGGPTMPELAGKHRWTSKRKLRIPVKLKPDHEYALSINCADFRNFKSVAGESAEPYPIGFRTGLGGAAQKAKALTKEQNTTAIAALKTAMDERYSYRDLRGIDWNKEFAQATPELLRATTAAAFGRAAARLLAKAGDIHITVRVGDAVLPTHRRDVPGNCNLTTLSRIVPGWRKHNAVVATGRFEDGVGYILVTEWTKPQPDVLQPAFDALALWKDARGIIIDVRPNGGGDEMLAREIAGCFVSKPIAYARHDYRSSSDPSGFGKPQDRMIEPARDRPAMRCKVAVLMGARNMSSCDSFLLMMRYGAKARLFGEKSYGSSGNPKPVDLGNGVTVFLPTWRNMLPTGEMVEGVGIAPDEVVTAEPDTLTREDPVLQAARDWLK